MWGTGREDPLLRRGNYCTVTSSGDVVVKLTRHHFRPKQAAKLAIDIDRYHRALQDHGVDLSRLLAVDVVKTQRGCVIRHELEAIQGSAISDASRGQDVAAIRSVLACIADMPAFCPHQEEVVQTPVDASVRNYINHPTRGPVLVDLFPPLIRTPEGAFPIGNLQFSYSPTRRRFLEYRTSHKVGMMAHTIFSALIETEELTWPIRVSSWLHLDNWCYEVLPTNLRGRLRDQLRSELDGNLRDHALRVLASSAVCAVGITLRRPPFRVVESVDGD